MVVVENYNNVDRYGFSGWWWMVALAILDKLCDFDIHLPDYVQKCHNYASKS